MSVEKPFENFCEKNTKILQQKIQNYVQFSLRSNNFCNNLFTYFLKDRSTGPLRFEKNSADFESWLGYKQCLKSDTMDLCGELVRQCYETREFKQPELVSKYEPQKTEPLIFNEKDNKVNLRRCKKKKFYDAMLCRHLCSTSLVLKSTTTTSIDNCEEICFELTKSSEFSGAICPYQKYCASGCPCKYYSCDKISEKDQEVIPVWDLESQTSRQPDDNNTMINIFDRRKSLWRQSHTFSFDVLLYDYSKNTTGPVFVDRNALYPHEWIEINKFYLRTPQPILKSYDFCVKNIEIYKKFTKRQLVQLF